jgi:hypothetical protein
MSAIYGAVRDPKKINEEVKYIYEKFKFRSKYRDRKSKNPLKQDYDNLIILDACRYDMLREFTPFDNDVEYRILKSSNSIEFSENYINGNKFFDTVLVSANPYTTQAGAGSFSECYSPKFEKPNYWSKYFDPEAVYELSLEAYQEHTDKKMVVHFMQPHAPYYGEKAELLRDKLKKDGYKFFSWNKHISPNNNEYVLANLLDAAQEKLITKDDLKEVYVENLSIALNYVKKLNEYIDGKTIVTADHGELLKWRVGHGPNMDVEGLKKVPWQVLGHDDRRDVSKSVPDKNNHKVTINSDIDERLTALGYK